MYGLQQTIKPLHNKLAYQLKPEVRRENVCVCVGGVHIIYIIENLVSLMCISVQRENKDVKLVRRSKGIQVTLPHIKVGSPSSPNSRDPEAD